MEIKDIISFSGIILTLIASIAGLIVGIRNSRKTLYINSVTASRAKWLYDMKDYLSDFCGLTYHYASGVFNNPSDILSEEERKLVEKIDKLRFLIKFNLNPEDEFDKKIIDKIDRIPHFTDSKYDKLLEELKELTLLTQKLAKIEWEGIKQESVKGKLSRREKESLRKIISD